MAEEFEFVLNYRMPEDGGEEFLASIGGDSRPDGMVGLGLSDYLSVEFVREADTIEQAIAECRAEILDSYPDAISAGLTIKGPKTGRHL